MMSFVDVESVENVWMWRMLRVCGYALLGNCVDVESVENVWMCVVSRVCENF